MGKLAKAALLGAGLLGAWTAWGLYTTRTAERVPYDTLEALDGVEMRVYPETVVAETTARNQWVAFRRLLDYISGSNEGREELSMTAPVETTRGTKIDMTAPVRTADRGDEIAMAFTLPTEYDLESAPKPTDGAVRLRTEPERTVAVVDFSWYATETRVARFERELLSTLAARGVSPTGDPSLLRYNDPWTPPFMRRNEVIVEVDPETLD